MTNLTITVGGIEQVITVLTRYEDLPKLLDPTMYLWARDLHAGRLAGMGNYAPERPGQRYERTGELGASFWYDDIGPSHYEFTNDVPYAPLVVGNSDGGGQAWMHEGRWWTLKARVEEAMPALVESLEKALVDAAR